MEKKTLIDLTPDKSIYEKIGHGQHNLDDALAELIDNSFDARTDQQINGKCPLKIEINAPLTKKIGSVDHAEYVEIKDNASGMDETMARNCLVIAKTTRRGSAHGRFGMGLKQSCLSIGKKFTISTKRKGSNKRYVLHFDNEKFQNERDWNKFEMSIIDDDSDNSGTAIKIWDFWNPKLIYPNKVTNLKKKFSWVFGPFIKSDEDNQLELSINGNLVEAADLKSRCKETYIIPETKLKSRLPDGKIVTFKGWVGFLKNKGSTQGFSGFLLYRNLRLIKLWEHIGYSYHAEKRLVVGELHLDDFPVTIDKKDFNRISEQWEELAGEKEFGKDGIEETSKNNPGLLYTILKPYLTEERKKIEKRRAVKRLEKERKFAEEMERKKLAELEEIKKSQEKETDLKLKTEAIKQSITKSQINLSEKRDDEEKEFKLLLELKTFYDKGVFFIDDRKIPFSYITENATSVNPLWRVVPKEDKIEIFINLDAPFFYELKHDLQTYLKLITFMGLADARIKIKKEDKSNFINYFNDIVSYYSHQIELINSYDRSSHDLSKLNEVVNRLKHFKIV